MNTILQLNEFFIEGKNPNKSHVLLNITEPSTTEERQRGYFFAVCEIVSGSSQYIMKVQNIVDELENQYYENKTVNNSENLEDVLNQINKKTSGLIDDNIELDIALGAVINNKIIFSFSGKPQILLFYQTKQGIYKKMDLAQPDKNDNDDPKKTTVFSQIVEGKISQRDYLFIGTKKIEDYFTHDRIQKIICSREPKQSAQHLQRVLSELKNGLSFGGLIIHLEKKQQLKEIYKIKKPNKGSSAKSLRGLFNTHINTANILSPSILPRLNNNSKSKEIKKENVKNKPRDTQINSSHLRTRPTELPPTKNSQTINWLEVVSVILNYIWIIIKYLGQFLLWLLLIIVNLLKKIGQFLLELFLLITNIRNQRSIIINNWKKQINDIKINIKRMSLISKILSIVGLILIITIIATAYHLKVKQDKKIAQKNFNETVQQIKNKKDTAESYLIFDENTKAFQELKDANQKLSELKCKELQQENICNKLKSDLSILMNKVRKIYTVNPTLLTNWDYIKSDNANTLEKIFLTNKKIIKYSNKNEQLYSYSLLTKENETQTPSANINGFKAASTPEENDYSILIDDNNKLFTYDPKANSYKQSELAYPNSNNSITSAFIYSRRLYLVDATNNQIYRHDPTANGFGKGRTWITNNSGINLNDNVAIAIDGDIFTINKNGKIYKFSNGKQQDYSLFNIDPQLTSVNDMWTYYELNYLYILDGQNKRLIIIDKNTGKLKKQLTSVVFNNPTGMVISENNGVAYIYDTGKLYEIDMEI